MRVIVGLMVLLVAQFTLWVYFEMQSQPHSATMLAILCVVCCVILLMQFNFIRRVQASRSQLIDKINKLNLQIERVNFSLKVNEERLSEHKQEKHALLQENHDMLQQMQSKVTWITQQTYNDRSFMVSHFEFLKQLIHDKQFLRRLVLKKQQFEITQIDLIALIMQKTQLQSKFVRKVDFDEEQVLMMSDSHLLEAMMTRLFDFFKLFCPQLDCHLICYTDNDLGECVRLSFNLINCNKDCKHLIKQSSGKIHQKVDDQQEIGLGYQFTVIEQLFTFFNATYLIRDNHIESSGLDFCINLPLKTQTKRLKNVS